MTVFHRLSRGADGAMNEEVVNAEVSREFLERIPGGLFRYRAEGERAGQIDYVSKDLLTMFGCDTYDEFTKLTGCLFIGLVHPDDRERVEREIDAQIAVGDVDQVTYRLNRADGKTVWVDDRGRFVRDSDGTAWFYVTLVDITEKVSYQRQMERGNERLEILTALSNDVVFDVDCPSGATEVFGDFEGRFGRRPQMSDIVLRRRCQGECCLDISCFDIEPMMQRVAQGSFVECETSILDSDEQPIWFRYQSFVQFDEEGNPVRHVGRLLDTHEMVLRENQFRRKAEHDSLTQLYNREAATTRIEEFLADDEGPCSFLIIDVDDFKHINDRFGHPEGDRVLREIGSFLGKVMRKEDVVARFGGDEFTIFAKGLGPGPAIENILARIAQGPSTGSADDEPCGFVMPTLSIGAVTCVSTGRTFEEIYQAADETLYEAKRAGKAQAKLRVLE